MSFVYSLIKILPISVFHKMLHKQVTFNTLSGEKKPPKMANINCFISFVSEYSDEAEMYKEK